MAFCERRDSAHKKDKQFFTRPDPYVDAWMLITGRNREVFNLHEFVKMFPDVDKYIFPSRRMLKCRVMSDGCPILQAKQVLVAERKETAAERSAPTQQSTPHDEVVDVQRAFVPPTPRTGPVVKRRRRSVRQPFPL